MSFTENYSLLWTKKPRVHLYLSLALGCAPRLPARMPRSPSATCKDMVSKPHEHQQHLKQQIYDGRAPRWASKSSSNRCICNSRSWPMPKHPKGKADFGCRKNREAEMLPKAASASARKCGSFRDAQHNTHWWPQHTLTSWFHRSTGSPASTRPPESCVLSTLPSGQASLWFCRLQKVTTQGEECKPRYIYKGSSLVRASFT